ncbi:uncharacterized protein BT62DRAFT_1011614 [Guyanagaster necrorhizus]|uniref:Uncharacterized protein n=1 Tax=Guyanagaster necrorhizus TaxID=856835 RepID=A0A9P7VIL5_9AGAR|nr:uncharacterized protein BT62DRAFT_1011614 [Guyanagaster necrorhizus MCA 3950]KAG7441369.1 hypothetical protein BT62DRAFT_1011614 [Guyanagaster necrorhizus MCA 3950]
MRKRLRVTILLFCRDISTSEPSASHKYQWRHSGFYRRFPGSLATPSSEDHQRRILSSHKSRYPRTAPKSLKVVIAALRWPPNLSPHHLSARPRNVATTVGLSVDHSTLPSSPYMHIDQRTGKSAQPQILVSRNGQGLSMHDIVDVCPMTEADYYFGAMTNDSRTVTRGLLCWSLSIYCPKPKQDKHIFIGKSKARERGCLFHTVFADKCHVDRYSTFFRHLAYMHCQRLVIGD